jgi:drug/metabolite transporter (DMT)-like permease
MLTLLILNAACASTFVVGKILLDIVPPIFLTALRMLIAGAILLVPIVARKQQLYIAKTAWWLIALIGFFGVYVAFSLEFWSLQYMSPAKIALLFNTTPFITALCSYYLLNERLTTKKIIGLTIGCAGMLPTLLVPVVEGGFGCLLFFSVPELALLVAILFYSDASILMGRLVRQYRVSSLVINSVSMLIGGLLCLPTAFIIEEIILPPLWPFVGWLTLLVGAGSIIYTMLYTHLLRTYSATFLSLVGITIPLFTALFDWLLLGTIVTWDMYCSFFVVCIGLYIFYQEDLRQGCIVK